MYMTIQCTTVISCTYCIHCLAGSLLNGRVDQRSTSITRTSITHGEGKVTAVGELRKCAYTGKDTFVHVHYTCTSSLHTCWGKSGFNLHFLYFNNKTFLSALGLLWWWDLHVHVHVHEHHSMTLYILHMHMYMYNVI